MAKFTKTVSLAFFAALAAQLVNADDILNFNTNNLQIKENAAGAGVQTLTVALKEKPVVPASVYFSADNTKFDKCQLDFTPDNWDKPQELKVLGLPFMTPSPSTRTVPIKFTVYGGGNTYTANGKTQDLTTTRDPGCAATCSITGDPHYNTFDTPGRQYNFMGEGNYYLVRSQYLTVQAQQQRVGKVSYVYGLGIRFGKSSVTIDGKTKTASDVTGTDGITVSKSQAGNVVTYNVALNDGSKIRADIQNDGWMNVFITAAPYLRGQVAGLCGTFDGDTNNDFTGPDGAQYGAEKIFAVSTPQAGDLAPDHDLAKFGNAWQVPPADCIWTNPQAANQNAYPVGIQMNQCTIPPAPLSLSYQRPAYQRPAGLSNSYLRPAYQRPNFQKRAAEDPLPKGIVVDAVPSGFEKLPALQKANLQQPEKPNVQLAQLSEEQRKAAADQCKQRIASIQLCKDEYARLISNCEADIMGGMLPETIYTATKLSFQNECSAKVISMSKDSKSANSEEAKQVAKQHQFGTNTCSDLCTSCTDAGCTACKNPTKFEVKAGKCVPRA